MPNTDVNGAKPRTKTDQLVDGAVALYKTKVEMDHELAKMGLALQQVTAGMSAKTFQKYSDIIEAWEPDKAAK